VEDEGCMFPRDVNICLPDFTALQRIKRQLVLSHSRENCHVTEYFGRLRSCTFYLLELL